MKKILSLMIVAMLTLGLVTITARAVSPPSGSSGPVMYAYGSSGGNAPPDFPSVHSQNYTTFPVTPPLWNFSIVVNNMTNAQIISVDLNSADPTKAKVVEWYPGADLAGMGWVFDPTTQYTSYDNATGELIGLYTLTFGQTTITTPKAIFTIEVEGYDFTPSTMINIENCTVLDSSTPPNVLLIGPQPDGHEVIFIQPPPPPPPPPTSPIASKTDNATNAIVNDTIHFDATGSTFGYDGNASAPITAYQWDFGDGSPVANLSSTPDHVYNVTGTFTVTLTVFAPSANPYRNMTYDTMDTGSESQNVTISGAYWCPNTYEGRQIDLYTTDWRYAGVCNTYITNITGEGVYGGEADSFAPQDLVCLYAKLTYNGVPIAYKDVAFEADSPTGYFKIFGQNMTDGNGIATYCFRIPWPNVPGLAENLTFGDWISLAKASVADVEINDTLTWYVGWTVQIVSETSHPHPVIEGGTLTVDITVNNTALTNRNFTFTAVLYDNLGVPVGYNTGTWTAPPGVSDSYEIVIPVAQWAYIGNGTLAKDLFTAMPWNCGYCWSPEQTDTINIQRMNPWVPPF